MSVARSRLPSELLVFDLFGFGLRVSVADNMIICVTDALSLFQSLNLSFMFESDRNSPPLFLPLICLINYIASRSFETHVK